MTRVIEAGADRATAPIGRGGRYGGVAMLFHWTMALLVAFVGILGLVYDKIPREIRLSWLNVHALCGLAVLILVLLRLWWRATHTPPDLPGELGEFTRRTSHTAHTVLYALMVVTPLIGIVAFVWHARVLNLGLFQVSFPIPSTSAVYQNAEEVHLWLTYTLFALAIVHILAALWHHFIRRDGVLWRMLPGGPG